MVPERAQSTVSSARKPAAKRHPNVRPWLILRVILVGQSGETLPEPPGRDLLVSTAHTFRQIAAAIDRAFARWDVSHVHEFHLADARRVVAADDDGFEDGDLDEAVETLARLDIPLGRSFEYVFDLGAGWEHACTVLRDQVDPREEAGILPTEILPVFGWGAIPDQYGRAAPDSDDSSALGAGVPQPIRHAPVVHAAQANQPG